MSANKPSHAITRRVRRGALLAVERWNVHASDLVRYLQGKVGFREVRELFEALDERLGREEAEAFAGAYCDIIVRTGRPGQAPVPFSILERHDALQSADIVLLAVPDSMFVDALDEGRRLAAGNAFDLHRSDEASADVCESIDNVFRENGVPYQFEDGRFVRAGDPLVAASVLQPALTMLDRPGMETARRQMLQASVKFRAHDAAGCIDASRLAVESGLLALIDASPAQRPPLLTAAPEFNALVQAQVVPRWAESLVLAAPHFRNKTIAGHAGGAPVDMADAEAVLASAATSLLYLGNKLSHFL